MHYFMEKNVSAFLTWIYNPVNVVKRLADILITGPKSEKNNYKVKLGMSHLHSYLYTGLFISTCKCQEINFGGTMYTVVIMCPLHMM